MGEKNVMELRHIRYFIVLAEELNFSRAAEQLHIAQPSLSRQIKDLEDKVGAQLFYRTKRRVELTNAGKVFLNKAYHILDDIEQACISTRLSSTGQEGELRIGFNGAVQDIIPTLKAYQKKFPQVGLILKQLNSAEQVKTLNEKKIDIGVISIPIHDDKIKTFPIVKIPFKVALPENHPLVHKDVLHINDLANEKFIITQKSTGPLFYDAFMGFFHQTDFTPNITIQANDMHTVMALVAANMGITLTPTPMASISGIILKSVADINLIIEPTLAWRKDNQSEVLHKFLMFFNSFHREQFK